MFCNSTITDLFLFVFTQLILHYRILKNKTIYKGVITHMRGKQQDFRTEKYIRYGIRKFSFGAASVAIAVGLMFLGNGVVSATEVQSAETAITTSASSQGDKETEKAEPKAETVETVKPETVNSETIKPETVNSETVKPETVNPETVNYRDCEARNCESRN